MSSNQVDNINTSSDEFTLEDTYSYLQHLQSEREQEVNDLLNVIRNNEVQSLSTDITPEEIRRKRLKFIQSMGKFVAKDQPVDMPIAATPDFYNEVLKDLEDHVLAVKELNESTKDEIKELEKSIALLERKKAMFEQMNEVSLSTADNETSTYEAEMVITKGIFQETKEDLSTVVDTLYPDNDGFQEFLYVLTRALNKGGDDLYIDITEDTLLFVTYLELADVIQFHPNDKSKIKLKIL